MRTRIPISMSLLGIPLSKVNEGNRGNRAIRANGSNGKGSGHPVRINPGQRRIPIYPKFHFQGEQ